MVPLVRGVVKIGILDERGAAGFRIGSEAGRFGIVVKLFAECAAVIGVKHGVLVFFFQLEEGQKLVELYLCSCFAQMGFLRFIGNECLRAVEAVLGRINDLGRVNARAVCIFDDVEVSKVFKLKKNQTKIILWHDICITYNRKCNQNTRF